MCRPTTHGREALSAAVAALTVTFVVVQTAAALVQSIVVQSVFKLDEDGAAELYL